MDFLWKTDWAQLFTPQMSLLEILVRGTIIYLSLCLLLRVVLKRQAGKVSLSDLLVVTLVAGVCRNPLVRDDYSITDGVLVVATVLCWSFALDWLCFYFPPIHKLFHPAPVQLVRDGQVLEGNLQHELMTESQLRSKLRGEGVKEPAEVSEAWMEGDGHVSVIKKPGARKEPTRPDPAGGSDGQVKDSHSAASRERNGVPVESSPSATPEVRALLEAVRRLEDSAARSQQAAAKHQREIAEVRQAMARFGDGVRSPSRCNRDVDSHEPGERP